MQNYIIIIIIILRTMTTIVSNNQNNFPKDNSILNIFLVDKTGSMMPVAPQTVSGFQEFIKFLWFENFSRGLVWSYFLVRTTTIILSL